MSSFALARVNTAKLLRLKLFIKTYAHGITTRNIKRRIHSIHATVVNNLCKAYPQGALSILPHGNTQRDYTRNIFI